MTGATNHTDTDHSTDAGLSIYPGIEEPGQGLTLLERKGFGHPDTLADHLAEALSRAFSSFTLENCGAVLHHNFDKLALLGGANEVWYGRGRLVAPVRVLVNGRATRRCGNVLVPVEEIIEDNAAIAMRRKGVG